jgi:hypothetical protein
MYFHKLPANTVRCQISVFHQNPVPERFSPCSFRFVKGFKYVFTHSLSYPYINLPFPQLNVNEAAKHENAQRHRQLSCLR